MFYKRRNWKLTFLLGLKLYKISAGKFFVFNFSWDETYIALLIADISWSK